MDGDREIVAAREVEGGRVLARRISSLPARKVECDDTTVPVGHGEFRHRL